MRRAGCMVLEGVLGRYPQVTPKLSTTDEMDEYATGRKKAHLAASHAHPEAPKGPKKRHRVEQ